MRAWLLGNFLAAVTLPEIPVSWLAFINAIALAGVSIIRALKGDKPQRRKGRRRGVSNA